MADGMSISEFRQAGFLQEANRQFFHPLGLALEVVVGDDGEDRLGGIWDSRDDPEGFIFSKPLDRAKADHVQAEFERNREARERMMGAVVQPIDWAWSPAPPSP